MTSGGLFALQQGLLNKIISMANPHRSEDESLRNCVQTIRVEIGTNLVRRHFEFGYFTNLNDTLSRNPVSLPLANGLIRHA